MNEDNNNHDKEIEEIKNSKTQKILTKLKTATTIIKLATTLTITLPGGGYNIYDNNLCNNIIPNNNKSCMNNIDVFFNIKHNNYNTYNLNNNNINNNHNLNNNKNKNKLNNNNDMKDSNNNNNFSHNNNIAGGGGS